MWLGGSHHNSQKCKNPVRGYHTLQGDNSLKSIECFEHREKSCYAASEFITVSLLVGIC